MSLDFTDEKSTLVQVITWSNVDPVLCHHMASLGHSGLTAYVYVIRDKVPAIISVGCQNVEYVLFSQWCSNINKIVKNTFKYLYVALPFLQWQWTPILNHYQWSNP